MKFNKVSVAAAVSNYIEDNADSSTNFDEDLLYKWASDMSKKLEDASLEQWKERIVLLEVENFTTQIPPDFHKIIQAAYLAETPSPERKWELTQMTYTNVTAECDLEVNIKCPECHDVDNCKDCDYRYIEVDVDDIWRTAHPEYQYRTMKHYIGDSSLVADLNSSYNDYFKLMRPAVSGLFNMKYHIPTCVNLNIDTSVTYRIDSPTKLIVNFERGFVLLAYFGFELDEHGNHMIADIPEVYDAISFYLDEKLDWKRWRHTRAPQDLQAYNVSQQQRMRHMRLAKKKLTTIDIYKFWEDMKAVYWNRLGRPFDETLLK